ncbi:MAG: Ig-like domain-containing protein, partial [Muribaculaceae bacterium]|nr:Ig-like domain-containing protein [Muribaculaceae bacterium]
NLKYIDLPDGITSIGDYAFEGCSSLTSIDFPEGLTNVGKGAFWGCVTAESVALNGNPKIDVYYPFFWDSLTTVIYNTNKIVEYSTTLFDKTVYNNATLYVPQEFINKIKTSNIKPWHDFNNIQALPSINLNHQNLDTWTGAIKELYVDISPEEIPFGEVQIEWYSTDSSIVKINGEGNKAILEALKEGQTTVNCILSWGKVWKQTLQCHINIKKALEGIKIESDSDSLLRGESLILSIITEPSDADYQEITWTTSDGSVAEVKPTINGQAIVTGLKGGKVTITAEAGSKEEGCYASATLDLVVIQPVESLFIDPTSKESEEGETFQITATVLPEDATDKTLEWSSSDETVATVDQTGLVSVLKEGECVITAKTTDGSDLSANCYLSATTGISKVSFDTDETVDVYSLDGVKVRT